MFVVMLVYFVLFPVLFVVGCFVSYCVGARRYRVVVRDTMRGSARSSVQRQRDAVLQLQNELAPYVRVVEKAPSVYSVSLTVVKD